MNPHRSFALALLAVLGCTPPPSLAGQDQDQDQKTAADTSGKAPATGQDPFVPGLPGDPALQAKLDALLAAKGRDYQPRTHHLHADGRPKYTNRLITQTSPYLLQHAHNPVNWYPWGDEVFARALRENKPVLLSIGYSTCHWCHVMERESFEDESIAAYINANYLAIKVDREQRPDLDEVYMRAVQLLTGRGGWPMTVILTPAREPFFGGTYFPPNDQGSGHGKRPGFRSVLEQMKRAYDESPDEVVARAKALSQQIAAASSGPETQGAGAGQFPDATLIRAAVASVGRSYDPVDGGFGAAPKFPRAANLELLVRYAHRSGDPQALEWVRGTVDHIIAGGIRDHVGGGFHRYATDKRWLVPHFEKMLYDNAQLVVVLLELYQITADKRYAAVARETLDYLTREMSAPAGGFYSATDADSLVPGTGHSEEGWFFTWTQAEINTLLDPSTAAHVRAYYATTPTGNFEGRNILHTPRTLDDVATELGLTAPALADSLAGARRQLYQARQNRPPPLRDDKVLSAWNGLAISAFARAALVLDEPRYLARARGGAVFLATHHIDTQGRLLRSSLDNKIGERGYLDDYAFVIQADLDLFEASAELRWLEAAQSLQAQLDTHHLDAKAGGYYTTADDAEQLLTRNKPSYDGAEPSGNSVAALNLLRLYELTGDTAYREHATHLIAGLADTAKRNPTGVPMLLCALDFVLDRPLQIFVVTPPGQPAPPELLAAIRHSFVPNRALAIVPEDQLPTYQLLIPALEHKVARHGLATAYVCEAQVCRAPTSDPEQLAAQLARVVPYPE